MAADLLEWEGNVVSHPSNSAADADPQRPLPLGLEEQSVAVEVNTTSTSISFGVALLALGSIRGLGTRTLRVLTAQLGENLGSIWDCSPAELEVLLRRSKIQAPDRLAATINDEAQSLLRKGEDELERLMSGGHHLLTPKYMPSKLREISAKPEWLFVEGDVNALEGVHLAIVGSRTPSDRGLQATEAAAHIASAYPITIVSGLAEGIDAKAHQSSMDDGVRNVAFLGHGLDLVFPATTAHLRRRIVDSGGAVVTEYLPWEHYRKEQFVQRNRLQAALSDLVLVVDARSSGGTAHTARFAMQYGRELLALTWEGVADLALELALNGKSKSLEIFTVDGIRNLDEVIRSAADYYHLRTNALSPVLRSLTRESHLRKVRPEDLEALRRAITRIAERQSAT